MGKLQFRLALAAGALLAAAGWSSAGRAPRPTLPPAEAVAAPAGREVAREGFEAGADRWQPRAENRWEVVAAPAEEGKPAKHAYRLMEPAKQLGKFRSPFAYSLLKEKPVKDFVLTVRARCLRPSSVRGRDLLLLFGFRDAEHFYYVHFSNYHDNIHNAVLKVNGADREAIPLVAAPVQRLTDEEWHTLRVWRDTKTGFIRAYVDDMATPILVAKDDTFGEGLVGVGSFDDTGEFDDVVLTVP